MTRPRLFYIVGSLEANDTGDEIVSLLGRLSRERFEPRVVALGERDDLQARIVEMKVRVYPLGLRGLWGTVAAVPKVRKLLKNMDARIAHGFGSWGGSVAQLAAPRDVAVVRSVSRPPNHDSDMRGRALRLLERRARSRLGTHYLVPNESSRGLAVRAYGAPDGRVSVLPTSVEVGRVRDSIRRSDREHARILLGITPEETAFVLITEFESAARMDQVLEGFATATRERDGLRMFILGSGRHESAARWRAEELRLGDSVIFLGRGSPDGPIWAAADAAIDATPWSSWSRVALLSMAAGVPTVKRQDGTSGWPEEAGSEFPMISGQPDRFATELVALAAGPDVRSAVSVHGEEEAVRADVGPIARRLGALYESLAS